MHPYVPPDLDECVEPFVAIGIDFGTTYSGVSWARSTLPKELNEITGWSSDDHRNRRETQVPTLYDIDTGKWGYEITSNMTPMKWFKLLLLKNEDIKREEIRNSPQLQQARDQLAQSIRRYSEVQIVGFYLKKVWNHTYNALSQMMDIENLPLRVAITIPAIWPAYAQGAMSSFPEIEKNESFVVCDAGGGTVDVISYKVTSERPFKLEECVAGNGKLAGAFQIDQAFEAHLRGKAKLKISLLSPSEYNQFIRTDWEIGAKRTFNNDDEPKVFHLHPPSKAYGRMARLRNKETLPINKDEMKGFFSKSLTGIRSLVSDQHKKVKAETGKSPKKILLVGGLGSSEYVYDVLKETFNNVLRPSDGWSAVARGAVLRLLQENISLQHTHSARQEAALATLPDVISRRSRYHYGIQVTLPISRLDLDSEDDIKINPEGVQVTARMEWYLNKGDKINKTSRLPVRYHQFHRDSEPLPPRCAFDIMYSSVDFAPKRADSDVLKLCRIECDWDKPIRKWKVVGDPSMGWRKHEDLALAMGLEGEPKWEIRVGSNRTEHRFDVAYLS